MTVDAEKGAAARARQERISRQMAALYTAKMAAASRPEEREEARRDAEQWMELADEARAGKFQSPGR